MKRGRFVPTLALMWLGVLVVLLGSLCLGRYPVSPQTVVRVLISRFVPSPHVGRDCRDGGLASASAPCAGSSTGWSGTCLRRTVFQGLFHNPLVSPYVLASPRGQGSGRPSPSCWAQALQSRRPLPSRQSPCSILTWLVARSGRDRSHVTLVLAGLRHRQPVLLARGGRAVCC